MTDSDLKKREKKYQQQMKNLEEMKRANKNWHYDGKWIYEERKYCKCVSCLARNGS